MPNLRESRFKRSQGIRMLRQAAAHTRISAQRGASIPRTSGNRENGGIGASGLLNKRNAATPETNKSGKASTIPAWTLTKLFSRNMEPITEGIAAVSYIKFDLAAASAAQLVFDQVRDNNGVAVERALVFHDDGGVLRLRRPTILPRWTNQSRPHVPEGLRQWPNAGKRRQLALVCSKNSRQRESAMGYIDWLGNFVPGTERQSVPIFDILGNEIGYADKDGSHYYSHLSREMTRN